MLLRRLLALTPLALVLASCGDDGGSGATGSGATGAGAGDTGAGGSGGTGGVLETCFTPPTDPGAPTPDDVTFAVGGELLDGEQILFNDWNALPNELLTMRPDGSSEAVVFRAFRVWSFGVSHTTNKIAFAAGDPEQEANYGITIGDAIQPTFVYDAGCGTVGALTWGNLNDECHTFGPGDHSLYVCRRYDFTDQGMSKGYRIARIDMATTTVEWLTAEDPMVLTLSPNPLPDESAMIYYRIPVPGTASVVRAPLPSGAEQTVRERIGYPRLSPDGTRILVADFEQMGALVSLDLNGGSPILVADGESLTTAVWSPDGARVAFLRYDNAGNCSHVEVAAADGSEAMSPTRIHDCLVSGRFITELAWIDH